MLTKVSEHSKEKQTTPEPMSPTFADFERRYFKYLQTSRTQEEAYDKANDDYRKLFNVDRYSSYNSFRTVKNRRLKTK